MDGQKSVARAGASMGLGHIKECAHTGKQVQKLILQAQFGFAGSQHIVSTKSTGEGCEVMHTKIPCCIFTCKNV